MKLRRALIMALIALLSAVVATIVGVVSRSSNRSPQTSTVASTARSTALPAARSTNAFATGSPLPRNGDDLLREVSQVAWVAPAGMIHGCVPIAHVSVCLPHVTIDAMPLRDVDLLGRLVGQASGGGDVQSTVASAKAQELAIGGAVLDELLYREAVAEGRAATDADARAIAGQQAQIFQNDPAISKEFLPAGVGPSTYFFSASMLTGYRYIASVGREKSYLAGHLGIVPSPSGAAMVSADQLSSWVQVELSRHQVLVDGGSPNFSIVQAVAALPPQQRIH